MNNKSIANLDYNLDKKQSYWLLPKQQPKLGTTTFTIYPIKYEHIFVIFCFIKPGHNTGISLGIWGNISVYKIAQWQLNL